MKSSSHEFFDEVAAISAPHILPNNAYIFFPLVLYLASLEDSSGAAPKNSTPKKGRRGAPANRNAPTL